MTKFRSRIKELRNVKASSIIPHSKNFRLHPEDQKSALQAVMEDVGLVDAVLCREDAEGNLHLMDGHLRQELLGDDIIPVLVLDLDEDEANKILATHDKITGMAETDRDILTDLLSEIEGSFFTENASMRKLFADLVDDMGIPEETAKQLDKDFDHSIPAMQLQPHEHYDYLMVLARSSNDWNVLCDLLGLKPETLLMGRATKKYVSKRRQNKVGISRAIPADKLIEALRNGRD